MVDWLLAAVMVVVAALWLRWSTASGWRLALGQELLPTIDGQSDCEALPPVAIICPGRNEAAHLRQTLAELAEQEYPDFRVLFVDDDSDDDTPAITTEYAKRYPHMAIVRNEGHPPTGWVGKCWAVQRGYEALAEIEALDTGSDTGIRHPRPAEFICFTDADIHWHPRCLHAAMRYAQQHEADVVALFPQLDFGTTGERLVQAAVVLAFCVLFPLEKAVDPAYPDIVFTGGAFMLISRKWYDRVGGHGSVRQCVIEDLNLGRQLKRAGASIRTVATGKLLRCRMYEGWSDQWEGFTKNMYAGVNYRPDRMLGVFIGVVLVCIGPLVAVVAALTWAAAGAGAPAWTAAAAALTAAALQVRLMNRIRRHLRLCWCYSMSLPVGAFLLLLIAGGSVWRYYVGGNVWKGRAYGREGVKNPVES